MSQPGSAHATTTPIQHIVIIYQENHSFDDVLGDLCVIDARCNGSIRPVTLRDGKVVKPAVAPDTVRGIDHTVQSQVYALRNQWDLIRGCGPVNSFHCIEYYTPKQIPNLAALARQFAIADRTFQSADAPSWGAHLELAAATLDHFTGDNPAGFSGVRGWGCDSGFTVPWQGPGQALQQVPSCVPDYTLGLPNGGAFEPTPASYVPTIMDRLDAAALTWKLYSAPPGTSGGGYQWAVCPIFAECLNTSQSANMVPYTNVLNDAAAGTLPNWSVVLPSVVLSQHNGVSMSQGDNWIGKVVSAIENGPDWSSTAIFITYDDCGCFYDHVTVPAGMGIRSPMVIVSPYARAGYTDSSQTTVIGGLLAFTEHTFNLAPLTTVDQKAYAYSRAFNYNQTPIQAKRLPMPDVGPAPAVSPAVEDDGT